MPQRPRQGGRDSPGLSLERTVTKHKITPIDGDIRVTGEMLSPDKKTGAIMSPTSKPTKLSVDPELKV